MAQKWHTKPQENTKIGMVLQQMIFQNTSENQSLTVAVCRSILSHLAFVMRRSRARFLFRHLLAVLG